MVYRLVQPKYIERLENGDLHPTIDAFFGGTAFRISVDRAEKCDHDPSHTQIGEDPVCRLFAGEVRSIDVGVRMKNKTEVEHYFEACVEWTPLDHNYAHTDIYAAPERATRKAFRLLKDGLVALAKWEPGFEPKDGAG